MGGYYKGELSILMLLNVSLINKQLKLYKMYFWCERIDVKNNSYLTGILLHEFICTRSHVSPMYGSRSNRFEVTAK